MRMSFAKSLSHIFILLITSLYVPSLASQHGLIVKKANNWLQKFGSRIIPQGTSLTHPVTQGIFGSEKSIVVLFSKERYRPFNGWILTPLENGYKKLIIPVPDLPVSTKIKSVLFANADQDAQKELLILCEHISGIGRAPSNITPFYNTYVFDKDEDSIAYLESVSNQINYAGDVRTAKQLRRKLMRTRAKTTRILRNGGSTYGK